MTNLGYSSMSYWASVGEQHNLELDFYTFKINSFNHHLRIYKYMRN